MAKVNTIIKKHTAISISTVSGDISRNSPPLFSKCKLCGEPVAKEARAIHLSREHDKYATFIPEYFEEEAAA